MRNDCPVFLAANIIGKRWTILILLELHKGEVKWKRYSVLKRGLLDITPKILSERLKELNKEGIIERRVDTKNFPVKTEYALTESGEEIVKITKLMKKWAEQYKLNGKGCGNANCKYCKD